MDELFSLWLPIVLSAVAVFVVCAIFWMAPLHHKNDWVKADNEDALLNTLRSLKPGQYWIPFCHGPEAKTEEGKRRMQQGPHAAIIRQSGPPNMARNMVLTFIFYLVASVFVGYIASVALAPGADFAHVFQVAGTAGIMTYAFGSIPGTIWLGASARSFFNELIDGVIFGLITGAIFAWLWPSVAAGAAPGV